MKKALFPVILILLPVLTIALSLFAGRYSMNAGQTVQALLSPNTVSPEQLRVVWYLRLPRAVASAMCGAALAVSGAAFQGVFRNPLVNSGLLGVSNGAGFGACLAIVFFGGIQLMSIGIMGEYIGRIYDEVKQRPLYIEDKKN